MSPYNPESIGPTVPYNNAGGAGSIKDLEFVENEVTGRTYQRRTRTTTGPEGDQVEYDVWEVLSEPRNRTFVGPEDPMTDVRDSYTDSKKFKSGDLWWDTSDMELRVLHSPKLGDFNDEPVLGRKTWVSSTHPTAYMLGDNVGSNKNQVLGLTGLETDGAFNEITYEHDKIEFNLVMPFYTGDDGPDSDVEDDDKRYTHSYQCIPTHNGDPLTINSLKALAESPDPNVSGPAITELQDYENLISVDPNDSSIVKVEFGEIAADSNGNQRTQTVYVEATTKVKTAYIDYFVSTETDGVITAPQEVASKVIKVYPKFTIDVDIPVSLEEMTLGEMLAADGISVGQYPDGVTADDPVVYFKFPSEVIGNLPDEVDQDQNITAPGDEITVFKHIKYMGLGPQLDLEPDGSGWEQIPYNTTYVNLNRLGKVNLYFVYGNEGDTITLPDGTDMPVAEFRDKYSLEFYDEGYRQQPSGDFLPTPDELDGIYKNKVPDTELKEFIEDGKVGIVLTCDYQKKPTDGRFYMIVKDENGNFIHDMKGALNVDNPTPFDTSEI